MKCRHYFFTPNGHPGSPWVTPSKGDVLHAGGLPRPGLAEPLADDDERRQAVAKPEARPDVEPREPEVKARNDCGSGAETTGAAGPTKRGKRTVSSVTGGTSATAAPQETAAAGGGGGEQAAQADGAALQAAAGNAGGRVVEEEGLTGSTRERLRAVDKVLSARASRASTRRRPIADRTDRRGGHASTGSWLIALRSHRPVRRVRMRRKDRTLERECMARWRV